MTRALNFLFSMLNQRHTFSYPYWFTPVGPIAHMISPSLVYDSDGGFTISHQKSAEMMIEKCKG